MFVWLFVCLFVCLIVHSFIFFVVCLCLLAMFFVLASWVDWVSCFDLRTVGHPSLWWCRSWRHRCDYHFILNWENIIGQLKLGGGNSNMFYFHPEPWGRFPFWGAYFSKGLKPPTRKWLILQDFYSIAFSSIRSYGCFEFKHQQFHGHPVQLTKLSKRSQWCAGCICTCSPKGSKIDKTIRFHDIFKWAEMISPSIFASKWVVYPLNQQPPRKLLDLAGLRDCGDCALASSDHDILPRGEYTLPPK